MKMQPCPHCNGSGWTEKSWNIHCYICEGTGTIPAEPVSHCQACGEPVELGLEWCEQHKPAADLWQALNLPAISENLAELIPSDSQPPKGWSAIEGGLEDG